MMTPERAALKARLLTERVVTHRWKDLETGRWRTWTGLVCELCGKKVGHGPDCVPGLDMHEVIITRGDVRGNARLDKLVTESKFNCCLVCNRCNTSVADAKWAVDLLAQKLVERYGAEAIIAWIESLEMKAPTPYIQTVKRAAEIVEKPLPDNRAAIREAQQSASVHRRKSRTKGGGKQAIVA